MPGVNDVARWYKLLCLQLILAVTLQVDNTQTTYAEDTHPDLLHVWEYDTLWDWERVHLHDPATPGAVAWILGLSDRLTQILTEPLGLPLMVSDASLKISASQASVGSADKLLHKCTSHACLHFMLMQQMRVRL